MESNFDIAVVICYWDEFDQKNSLQSVYYNGRINNSDTGSNQYERDVFVVPLSIQTGGSSRVSGELRVLMVESTDEADKYQRVGLAEFNAATVVPLTVQSNFMSGVVLNRGHSLARSPDIGSVLSKKLREWKPIPSP